MIKKAAPLFVLATALLWGSLACKTQEPQPEGMMFHYPSAGFQHYSLAYTFKKGEFSPFTLKKVLVNGAEVRDFVATGLGNETIPSEGYKHRYPLYNKKVNAEKDLSFRVLCNWQKGQTCTLEVQGLNDEDRDVRLEASGQPDEDFGYWNTTWPYCATLVLREQAGIRRIKEPVHIKMALYSDRLTDPEREIRVVELDVENAARGDNPYKEVPSQVYHVFPWENDDLTKNEEYEPETGEPIIRYLPTTTLEVAFLAEAEPFEEKIYLVFYGNPDAPAPEYATDLTVSGPEIGQIIENSMMRIDLDDSSGAIFGVFLKQGKNVLFEHKLETNGAVHWNPGAYSPPHAWVHASDWKNPSFSQVTGPVFHMTKRWAPLPHMDDVLVTITYVFYAEKAYIISSSLTDVLEEFYGKALRNGEIVFNHEQLNTFAYKSLRGSIHEFPIATSLKHPEHVVDIPYNVPWVAFINPQTRVGFGAITLELANTNTLGGISDAEQPYIYVANGPWIYFSRALNYSFGSNNTSRMIHAAQGSLYYEKTAFLPFVLGDAPDEKYKMIEEAGAALRHPLTVSYYLDTDNRNNTGWVVPILVEPFDEGVEGAVGMAPEKKKEAKKEPLAKEESR